MRYLELHPDRYRCASDAIQTGFRAQHQSLGGNRFISAVPEEEQLADK